MYKLITPHGGEIGELYLSAEEKSLEVKNAQHCISLDLTPRQICDLEMLLNGGFSPLKGYLNREDYQSVLNNTRLTNGIVWPIPITLDITKSIAESININDKIALRDVEGVLIATMEISEIWEPDKSEEALKIYGTTSLNHPGVKSLLQDSGAFYISGKINGIESPTHYDYKNLRESPMELRARFKKLGWNKIVAFHTRSAMHRAQQEMTFRAAQKTEANLLIHPTVGMSESDDITHYSRIRCYQHVLDKYPSQTTTLSLLPLASRLAGPREALLHAIVRQNYGCSHIIIGKDHSSPDDSNNTEAFYPSYEAQEFVNNFKDELEIQIVTFSNMVYVQEKAEYLTIDEVEDHETQFNISNTELHRRLNEGLDIPDWYSFPEVIQELRKTYLPKYRQGYTVFFTGLSGAGKSTIANALLVKLLQMGGRQVTLLDGDVVRQNLSKELGFSKEHRNINIERIGYVASEITKHGGIAICAPIAPYASTRQKVREMIEVHGGFIEVHVSTSLEVCELRDRKGLYAKARKGIIKEFTGISDPYEEPKNAELNINTEGLSSDQAAQQIILKLERLGYIK